MMIALLESCGAEFGSCGERAWAIGKLGSMMLAMTMNSTIFFKFQITGNFEARS